MQCAVCSMQCRAGLWTLAGSAASRRVWLPLNGGGMVEEPPTLWPFGVPAVSRVIWALPGVAMVETR